MRNLPEEIRTAINSALRDAQRDRAVFHVYAAAIKIGETVTDALPAETLSCMNNPKSERILDLLRIAPDVWHSEASKSGAIFE